MSTDVDRAVTVVIPTRDRPELLRRSIRSSLGQAGVKVSVIVVDDGGAGEAAAAVVAPYSDVCLVRHDASQGVSAARNAGLARAVTSWVAFLDDDDYWAPTKLARQLDALAGSPEANWSCVGAIHVDQHYRPFLWQQPPSAVDALQLLMREGGIPGGGSGVLVSRHLALEVGGFDSQFSLLADWDFYLRLALRSPLAPVDEPLLAYYRHSRGMYYNPVALAQELALLTQKYSQSPSPVRLERVEWVVQLLTIALQRRRFSDLRIILRADVARGVRLVAVLGKMVERCKSKVSSRRSAPPNWRDEPLEWLLQQRWWASTTPEGDVR